MYLPADFPEKESEVSAAWIVLREPTLAPSDHGFKYQQNVCSVT